MKRICCVLNSFLTFLTMKTDGSEVSVPTKALTDATELLCVNNRFVPKGVSSLLYDSLKLCDDLVLSDLCQNIVISGGTSMLPGLGDRLDKDLKAKFSTDRRAVSFHEVRVLPSVAYREPGYTTQRKHAAWIGGRYMTL